MSNKVKRRKKWFEENGPCQDCDTWKDLELHHVDPLLKEDSRIWSWSDERREAELAKCIVLCTECHKDIHVYLKRLGISGKGKNFLAHRRLAICITCNKEGRIVARNMCYNCYNKWQRTSNLTICAECKEEKPHAALGLCSTCYSRYKRANPNKRRMIVCAKCGEKKRHEGKGLCRVCYMQDYYKTRIITCPDCQREMPLYARGICGACYQRRKKNNSL